VFRHRLVFEVRDPPIDPKSLIGAVNQEARNPKNRE
jgi:hypothetical protein